MTAADPRLPRSRRAIRAAAAAALSLLAALATTGRPASAGPDERPGQRFHVRPGDLPPPFATRSAGNPAERIPRPADATLSVPAGFRVGVFAADLDHARWMTVAANGDVLLAEPLAGKITVLRDVDGDGRAEVRETLARALDQPHGLAIANGHLYIGEPSRIIRFPYRPGDLSVSGRKEVVGGAFSLGDGGGHWTRNIVFAPDGSGFFVAVGSRGNIAEEAPPRATIQRFDRDGGNQATYAAGLRNPVGIAFHPTTGALYTVVNERDGLGDGLVPDFLTRVAENAFYGWPYAYIGPNPDPSLGHKRADLVGATAVPDVLFESHSAPLGLAFYDGTQFPAEYRGDAFVALHGSWNAAHPTGYKVVRVRFDDGRPRGDYENFAVGFWHDGTRTARVWGRPAGLAIARDGSLLIADDVAQAVWRISYGR
jgi:glucose/arabinose dehydrogenase